MKSLELVLGRIVKSKKEPFSEVKVSQSTTFATSPKKSTTRIQTRLENIRINLNGWKYDVVK